ncbi:MAG: DUF6252 family protein [Mesonia hippocampi]|uniref:DUF6252 family protein n=1 Tax=Mesonia hippocampi TaxID=1628250 RepID=UPI003F9821E9
MKKLLLIALTLSLYACNSDDDKPQNPVDQLPKATQTGANTAGCLVNGEAFLPKGGGLAGNKNCFYQYVEGGYHFGMQFSNSAVSDSEVRSVILATKNATIDENQIYQLNSQSFYSNSEDGRGGGYLNYTAFNFEEYSTTSEVTGEMTITKLDFENHIVSGTFWFDAVNDKGEIVEIREGRFDMKFTN